MIGVNQLTETECRKLEHRLRAKLRRQELAPEKCRTRDWRNPSYSN
jgi:hypothetical protein